MADQIVTLCGQGKQAIAVLSGAGVTATATELNKLDGVTASTAELNKVDGYTGSAANLNSIAGHTKVEHPVFYALQNLTNSVTYRVGSSTATFIPVAGLAEVDGYVMPRAGSVVGLSARLGAVLGAVGRRVEVEPYKWVTASSTGTALNGTVTMSSTSGVESVTNYTIATKTFVAGDRLGLRVTTGTTVLALPDLSAFLTVVT